MNPSSIIVMNTTPDTPHDVIYINSHMMITCYTMTKSIITKKLLYYNASKAVAYKWNMK